MKTHAPRLTVITHSGQTTSLCSRLVAQVADFAMYKQADNFAGWLTKRFIMDGLPIAHAEAKALKLLQEGCTDIIDVRI